MPSHATSPDYADIVLIVTGAAQGIGRAIAERAVAEGVTKLLLVDIDDAGLTETVAQLQSVAQVETMGADLASADVPRLVALRAKERFGRIDALANAAGITSRGGFLDGTSDLWDRIFAVNARAAFLMMQEAIRDMTDRMAPGTIVNIQSTNAHCGAPDLSVYAASKGALQTLTKNAANAFLHNGIRVNGINLGWTVTPSEDRLQRRLIGEDWVERAGQSMPLGRLLLPDDAARMAVHLLGPDSAPLTGASIDLDQRVLGAPS